MLEPMQQPAPLQAQQPHQMAQQLQLPLVRSTSAGHEVSLPAGAQLPLVRTTSAGHEVSLPVGAANLSPHGMGATLGGASHVWGAPPPFAVELPLDSAGTQQEGPGSTPVSVGDTPTCGEALQPPTRVSSGGAMEAAKSDDAAAHDGGANGSSELQGGPPKPPGDEP